MCIVRCNEDHDTSSTLSASVLFSWYLNHMQKAGAVYTISL